VSVETTAERPAPAPEGDGAGPLVEVRHLKVFFPIKQGILIEREVARVHAVNDVTLEIDEGETLGLVGESGRDRSASAGTT
jgi:ABC-type oligopeptide transport system ATPase subunit